MQHSKNDRHPQERFSARNEAVKARDLPGKIARLQSELLIYKETSDSLKIMIDAIFIQVALTFGEQVSSGVWRVSLPTPEIEAHTKNYALSATVDSKELLLDLRLL